jgi:branched-chain amino acid transport system permease protein
MLTEVLIMALFAVSLNLVLGYGGIISLGHASFFGIGAYTLALLIIKSGFPLLIALICTPLTSAAAGIVMGYLAVRLSPWYCAMLTLAVGQLIFLVIFKWNSLTGGETGLLGLSKPQLFSNITGFYYFALINVLICFILIIIIKRSPFGKVVQAIRENKQRVEFLGINTRQVQLTMFTISAALAGFAGGLYALFTTGAFPAYAGVMRSTECILYCVIGGLSTLGGPPLGALVVIVLRQVLSDYMEYWPTVMGTILIMFAIAFRGGIAGMLGKNKIRERTGASQ